MENKILDFSRRTVAVLASAVLALGAFIPCMGLPFGKSAHAASDTVQMRVSGYIEYTDGSWHTHMYKADDGNGEVYAYCVEPDKLTPSDGTYEKKSLYTLSGRRAEMRADLWFAYGGPGFDKTMWPETNWNGEAMSNDDFYVLSHIMLAETFCSDGSYALYGTTEHFKRWFCRNISGRNIDTGEVEHESAVGRVILSRAGEVPSDFECYLIAGSSTQNLACSSYYAPVGTMKINKSSSNAAVTKNNGCYSMEGIKYGIYTQDDCSGEHDTGERLVLNKKGYAELSGLTAGRYYVREIKSSVTGTGYSYDPTVYTCKVVAGQARWVTASAKSSGATENDDVSDEPTSWEADVLVQKYDILTMRTAPSGPATFENAIFEVKYFDNLEGDTSGAAKRTWTFKTDAQGKVDLKNNERGAFVSGDALYRSPQSGKAILPLGTYMVSEVTPPEGYELPEEDRVVTYTLKQTGTGVHDVSSGGYLPSGGTPFFEGPVRHDLSFTKKDLDTQRPMAGIPFLVTLVDGQGGFIERHVIVTDANGMFDSSARHVNHTTKTNANDVAVVQNADGSFVVDEDSLDADAGLWFGKAADGRWMSPNDAYGAFPDSTTNRYIFEELPVAANQGKALVTFEAYAHAAHATTIDLGTVGNMTPTLATTAIDGADGDKLVSRDFGAVIKDSVSYSGLVAGKTYEIRGVLMDATSGEVLRDAGGNEIRANAQFTATASSGVIELTFAFDATSIAAGTKAVACETLLERGRLLTVHDALDDSAQTVTIVQPEIRTSATDDADGDSTITGDVDATIRDRVSYSGLTPGANYVLEGMLMDKESGEPFYSNGSQVTSSMTLSPENSTGTIDMTFTFDAAELAPGTEIVVFEHLYRNGAEITSHADISDEGQTVSVLPPTLRTKAADPFDGDNVISADTETLIADTVEYEGLKPGCEYVIKGTLVDKETGRPLLDPLDCAVTAVHVFTPVEASGSTEVTFSFDATNVNESTTAVAFEELHRNGRRLASHIDLEDAAQTVIIEQPAIQTFASADGTSKYVMRDTDVSIIDTVTYRGLKAGKTYKLEGSIVDKASGEAIIGTDGNPVGSETEFTADTTTGTVELPFTLDTTPFEEGTELVVFERLLQEGVTLATHESIESARQTVTVARPKISTNAKSANDTKELTRDTSVEIVDTVSYENLAPGCEYTLSGTVMNKAEGTPLADANGEGVAAQASFTPERASGETTLTFTLDASDMESGAELVVFEKLLRDGSEIAAHEDIEDASQTVTIRQAAITTKASDPQDGDQVILAREDASILDTIAYEGLQPGATYKFIGELMDKNASEPLLNEKGETISATCTFVPEEQSGEVTVSFACDASSWVDGKDVVVFESLYRDDKLIAVHTDYENVSQTVTVTPPQIRTHATDAADGNKEILRKDMATIVDSVEYLALEPGKTYRLAGELMVNDGTLEGKPALDASGVPITAQTTFTPDTSHGTVEVSFDIDTSILKEGTYLVAFETLTHDEVVQAVHKDIQDDEQTVQIVSPPRFPFVKGASATLTPAGSKIPAGASGKVVDTGDVSTLVFAICAALSMLAALGIVWLRYRIVPEEKQK